MRDCIIKTKDLINYALELGHEVIGITDHECISNHILVEDLYEKAKEKNPNFKVIRGNEIYLCRNGLNNENYDHQFDKYYHFILLAKDELGHQQLREISTRAWKRSYISRGNMRRVPTYYQDLIDIIGKNPGHIIGSTACLGGSLPTQLLKYKESQDENFYNKILIWIKQMNNLFTQGNFFFELQPSDSLEQKYVNRKLVNLSKELNIPYIISTDSHYLRKEDRKIHKAYLNSQNGDREVDSFYATTYLMDTKELESYMELTREELDAADNSILNIKNMCEDYTLKKPLKIPRLSWIEANESEEEVKMFYDVIPTLKVFFEADYDGDNLLARAIVKKLKEDKRLQDKKVYDAIEECLKMTKESSKVNKTHWSAYFLNLQKIVQEIWNSGSLVGCGRGSGVGFILLYILGITQINPVWESTQTLPWRFLNPARVSVLD